MHIVPCSMVMWHVLAHIFFVGANLCLLFLASCHSHPPSLCHSHPCSMSQWPPCTSHAHDRIEWSQLPRSGGRLGWSNVWQTCQHDGLLRYVKVGSRCASCLDTAVVLGDVHAAAALSLASLDQGRVGHSIQDEVWVYLSSLTLLWHPGFLWIYWRA